MVFDRKYNKYYDMESNEYDETYNNDGYDTDDETYIDEDEYNEVYTNILCVISGIVVVIYVAIGGF